MKTLAYRLTPNGFIRGTSVRAVDVLIDLLGGKSLDDVIRQRHELDLGDIRCVLQHAIALMESNDRMSP